MGWEAGCHACLPPASACLPAPPFLCLLCHHHCLPMPPAFCHTPPPPSCLPATTAPSCLPPTTRTGTRQPSSPLIFYTWHYVSFSLLVVPPYVFLSPPFLWDPDWTLLLPPLPTLTLPLPSLPTQHATIPGCHAYWVLLWFGQFSGGGNFGRTGSSTAA